MLPKLIVGNDIIFIAEGDWVSRLLSGKSGKKDPKNPVKKRKKIE
jgi:hypothetical protein